MKIYFTLPGGWVFHYEKEPCKPLPPERFAMICRLIGMLGGTALFIYFFLSLCRL